MTESEAKTLCMALMRADTEDAVIDLLRNAGYWDAQPMWRFYGDYENNYNTIGNQQSRPDAALVEKLVNSVDARLMNECMTRRIDPEAPDAPRGIQEAVAMFFEGAQRGRSMLSGRIREWTESKRTEVARGITLAATGGKPGGGNPCFTISDVGEGQTPDQMPDTLLSLNRSNKLRIPFVQGKFNMGGTGVLKFCGKYNLQLVVSRRNPALLQHDADSDDRKWSFSVVRREDPCGNRRSSVYTYLAPFVRGNGQQGRGLLRFSAGTMPIFPNGKVPCGREAGWGTLIKLYEYSASGFKSHILMKDGLLGRVDLLLPDIALPMRFYECRDYKGHEGSFETTLTGVRVRLEDDKGQNVEDGFPTCAPVKVAGEELLLSIYAFKKKRGETYRKNEGVVFTVNGQTHGYLTQDFFSRKNVGLSYLADAILVIADCTKFSGRAREDLFMNSRDRLSGGELRQQIEESLEDLLKQHDGLRALKERRRREEIAARLDDAKPLEDILGDLLKHSPALSDLFLRGLKASTPFKTITAQAQEREYRGRRFPSYFKLKGKEYGQVLQRECHLNMRCRLALETDAENEYFSRPIDPGEFRLTEGPGAMQTNVENYVLNLQNGIASLSLPLPTGTQIGQTLHYTATVNDCSRTSPFSCTFSVTAKEVQEIRPGPATRRKPPIDRPGEEREVPAGIQLPKIRLVEEHEWQDQTPPFDKYTALRIRNAGVSESGEGDAHPGAVYDFYLNIDNAYLKAELKTTKADVDLVRAQFKYGLVLVGLAMVMQDADDQKKRSARDGESDGNSADGASVEKKVEEFCRAIAPVVVPMITSLGSLSIDHQAAPGASGEAT